MATGIAVVAGLIFAALVLPPLWYWWYTTPWR